MHIEKLNPDLKAAYKSVSKKIWQEFFETLRQAEYRDLPHAKKDGESIQPGEKTLTEIQGRVNILNEMEEFTLRNRE